MSRQSKPLTTYPIWRRANTEHYISRWHKTARTVQARDDEEAQRKMFRMFAGAGFHSMGLFASLNDPNG